MSGIVISNNGALPRDIDVTVTISKPQAEATTDFSILCFVTPQDTTNSDFVQGPGRIRYYTSLAAVQADFAASSEPVRAATDFFAQSPRAKTFAIGKVFSTAQKGFLQGGLIANKTVDQWKTITNGSFKIKIDSVEQSISSVSFASITDLGGIASALQTKLRAVNSGGFTSATVVLEKVAGGHALKITSGGTAGASSSVSFVTAADSGTFIGDMLGLAQGTGYTADGYTPGDFASELGLIKDAAIQSGRFVYGWVLDRQYRDASQSETAAAWAEAQDAAILGLTTNSPTSLVASSTTDIGYKCMAAGYKRTYVVYHDNAYYYPEVAILAYALHVDYSGLNTTITTKFKDLFGIPTVPITVDELEVLNSKRVNTFTKVGLSSRTFREGVDSNDNWFMDDLINLDNFKEYLQVSVYNVFLRNKKVPYNNNGVSMLRNAMTIVCDQFVKNGAFSERPLSPEEQAATGRDVEPAYSINFAEIFDMTVADRAKRVGPPATIVANLTGAIHSLAINVEAYA